MDTLRGTFDSGVPADDSQDWDAYSGAPADEKVRELPPEAIGQDERAHLLALGAATENVGIVRFSARKNTSRENGTSGIKQKLTSLLARVAAAAMNPDSRPISLTRPMPLPAPTASTCAVEVERRDSATAVS